MKLSNTLRTGALAAGLVAVLGTSACQTTNRGGDEALLGILFMGAGIQQNKPAVAAVGRGLVDYGAAKAGRSEINVNVYGGGNRNDTSTKRKVIRTYVNDNKQRIVDDNFKNSAAIPAGRFYSFAANYWKDFNGDGQHNPNEYVGIKNKFREDEELILVLYDNRFGLKDREIVSEIYSPNGNLIDTDKFNHESNTGQSFYHGTSTTTRLTNYREVITAAKKTALESMGISNIQLNVNGTLKSFVKGDHLHTVRADGIVTDGTSLTNSLFKKGGYGNYKIVWKIDGKYNGSNEFEIVPSLTNKKISKK